MNYPRWILRNMIRETGRKFGSSPSQYLKKEWNSIQISKVGEGVRAKNVKQGTAKKRV